jgi:PAS domain S-box-containing protein
MLDALDESEQVLRRREARYRTWLDRIQVAVVVHGADSRIAMSNPLAQEILGLGEETLQGKGASDPAWSFVREDGSAMPVDEYPVSRALATGQPVKGLIVGVRRSDRPEILWELASADVVPDESGGIAEVVVTFVDITRRVRAEEEVRRLNQELEQRVAKRTEQLDAVNKELEAFTHSVSHDLRAPLRHIAGFLELLQKRIATVQDEKVQHYMARISEGARDMGRLIDDLLAFSRTGFAQMVERPVDLKALVHEVIRELEPEAGGRRVAWAVGALPVVAGDRATLRIVLVNLLSNALKFTRTRPSAEIEIGVAEAPGETVVSVRDNGVGFDGRYAGKLFGVFQRLHRAEDFEGTGLGLASVRRIIARHGGRTWAEGTEGVGAVFHFSVPRHEERA